LIKLLCRHWDYTTRAHTNGDVVKQRLESKFFIFFIYKIENRKEKKQYLSELFLDRGDIFFAQVCSQKTHATVYIEANTT